MPIARINSLPPAFEGVSEIPHAGEIMYRAFILTRSDERATELSNLAHAAGYQPQSDIWVHCKFHYDYGPYKVLGNGWDMEADSLIINAGAIASHAKDLGQPKSLQWYQMFFERLGRREYRKLVFELEETMKTLHP